MMTYGDLAQTLATVLDGLDRLIREGVIDPQRAVQEGEKRFALLTQVHRER